MTISKESIRQYLVASIVSLLILILLSLYLFVRRGYFTLAIANKAVAATALVILGIVLLLGPLSRAYDRFDRWVLYRKELGILALIAAVIHVFISIFPLSDNHPLTPFFANPIPMTLGLIGLALLIGLFLISFESLKNKVGADRWWKFQYHGVRLAGVVAGLHLVILKTSGWVHWWNGRFPTDVARPYLPPASLLAALFALFVILVRLSEVFKKHTVRILIPCGGIAILATTGWLFLR